MDKDERRSHKRARRKSPEYLVTGYSDRRCADRDSALRRAREDEPTLRHGEWHRQESSRSIALLGVRVYFTLTSRVLAQFG